MKVSILPEKQLEKISKKKKKISKQLYKIYSIQISYTITQVTMCLK